MLKHYGDLSLFSALSLSLKEFQYIHTIFALADNLSNKRNFIYHELSKNLISTPTSNDDEARNENLWGYKISLCSW
jgi:hypothetical protein